MENLNFEHKTASKKCGTAPNIIIDDVVYSGSELKDLKKLLEKFM